MRHRHGDTKVYNLLDNPKVDVLCHQVELYCQGIKTCKHINPEILVGCKHYELDKEDVKMLWNQELNANKQEEGSAN